MSAHSTHIMQSRQTRSASCLWIVCSNGLIEWLSVVFFAIAAEVNAEDNAAPVKRVKVEGGWSDASGSMPAFGKTLIRNHCISSLQNLPTDKFDNGVTPVTQNASFLK